MARTKMAAKPTQAAAEAAPEYDPAITPAAEAASATATLERRPPASEHAASGPQSGDVVTPIELPWVQGVSDQPEHERRHAAKEASPAQTAYAADPHEKISISLNDIPGGPAMHLLRSHKYKQMQVRFDREQPDEKYLKMLKDAGWTDRTESEGVYTKQIDPDRRWQSVQKMELEFRDVANAIRKGNGLGPVLEGLGA